MREDGRMTRKMAREQRSVKMGLFILGSSRKENQMAKGDISGLQEISMRVVGGMEKDMGLGSGDQLMERNMKEIGVLENLKVLVLIAVLMDLLMRDNSKML